MKKIFSRILAVGLLSAGIIGVSSCDYLDQKPENLKTTDMIWETRVDKRIPRPGQKPLFQKRRF